MQTSSDYGAYLANEASPLYTSTIVERCTEKLVDDWHAMRCQVGNSSSWGLLWPMQLLNSVCGGHTSLQ
jgi:hypothetical protein